MTCRHHAILFLCTVVVIAVLPAAAVASGWNDFSLSIDANHQIVRCNTFDIGLTGASSVIYMPERGGRTGPVTGYVVSNTHIFLRTIGQTPRNRFEGDTYVNPDSSAEYFFVVDKSNDSLRGPFTISEFLKEPSVAAFGTVDWIVPKNPHPERALAGQAMFLVFTMVIFGGPLLLILLVIVGVVIAVRSKGRSVDRSEG